MIALAFREPEQSAFVFDHVQPMPVQGRTGPCEIPLRSMERQRIGRFTAWRGRSGRRYVSSAFAATSEDALTFADAVVIAVNEAREIIAVRDSGPWGLADALARWRDEALAGGAVELHVHLIAATADERRAVLADLTPVH
jgi:hypothetical protein